MNPIKNTKIAYYRHSSSFIKIMFSDGSSYLHVNCESNRRALINNGYELVLLEN